MGSFWCGNALRFSVFTALFKDSKEYFKDTKSKDLLEHFLAGNTYPAVKNYYNHYGFIYNLAAVKYASDLCGPNPITP
jgi:hypothetical protein